MIENPEVSQRISMMNCAGKEFLLLSYWNMQMQVAVYVCSLHGFQKVVSRGQLHVSRSVSVVTNYMSSVTKNRGRSTTRLLTFVQSV